MHRFHKHYFELAKDYLIIHLFLFISAVKDERSIELYEN